MDEGTRNIVDSSQNIPPEPASAKQKIPWLPITIFAAVAIIAIAGYFIYSNTNKGSTLTPSVSKQSPVVQTNTGSPVDHTTYLQIQGLMEKTQFSKPEVIENSLRFFDTDGDGDQDVLGFLKLTFSYDSNSYDSNYLFSTWHRNGTEFVYYPDSYNDFRLSEKYVGGLPCSIYDLANGRVTLTCSKSGQEYLMTLRYQKNGVGYYRDVNAHIVLFSDNANWPEYNSKKGGINFNYPSDVQISEKTYEIYNDLITIITAKRNNQTLFEIKTVPEQPNQGGGTITLAQRTVFLKLSDGTYLSRNWMGGESNSQESGVFYDRANAYRENNVGSIGESNDQTNVNKGRSYVLFTPITSENNLREIDNIFASIKYVETPAIKDRETVVLKNNSISFANVVTLQVPGSITERQSTEKDSTALDQKDLEINFINSPIYQPAFLKLELLPFGSVGGTNAIGGGGYDVTKNGCYDYEKENITVPQKIGANQVCRFGYGDAGFSSQGYYILDPSRKYILAITQNSEYFGPYETFYPDLKSIVESVKFTQ